MTGILIRRGNLDTQRDARGKCAQRDNDVGTQRNNGHPQAKEKEKLNQTELANTLS